MREMSASEKIETYRWWGGWPDKPVVDNLVIKRKGKLLRVPRSCYSDLAWASSLKVNVQPGGCVVEIEGGDASVGYIARIAVVGDQIRSRTVRLGESPDTNYEKTEYVNKAPAEAN